MAECWPGDERDAYELVDNHCPVCVAAMACQGFCRVELETFRAVLGRDVSVERGEHIVRGDRRCVYVIKPKTAKGAATAKSVNKRTAKRKRGGW